MNIRGDNDFQQRSESIFASLDRLEPSKEGEKESKRSRRPHVVPDHVLHPEKWTEYSLEEDGSESLGRMNANELNKYAALSFLDEVKGRRRSGKGNKRPKKSAGCAVRDSKSGECSTSAENKLLFSKPSSENTAMETERKSLKDGVHTMPEYVVGKTKLPSRSKRLKTEPSTPQDDGKKKNVNMEHLLEKQEDELVDSDARDSGVSVPSEELEKESPKKEEIKFAKRKRKQDKNVRKQVKTSDDEDI